MAKTSGVRQEDQERLSILSNQLKELAERLRQAGVQNVEQWEKDCNSRMITKAGTFYEESVRDLMREGEYALQFVAGGCTAVILKPTGEKGPDLSLCAKAQEIFIEVTRFRQDENLMDRWVDQVGQSEAPCLVHEGEPLYRTICRKIKDELHQLLDNGQNVVIVHSEHVLRHETAFEMAVCLCLRNKATNDQFEKLGAAVFYTPWENGVNHYYVFWNEQAANPLQKDTIETLGRALDPNFKFV